MATYTLSEMLDSVDIPLKNIDDGAGNISANDFVLGISGFLSKAKMQQLWSEWNPHDKNRIQDSVFFAALQKLLTEGLERGFRLTRFRDLLKDLPASTVDNASNWITFFEEAATVCSIRVHLSKENYNDWLRPEGKNGQNEFERNLDLMADGLFYELGIFFPKIDFSVDETLGPNSFRIEWNDFLLPPEQGIGGDKIFVNDTVARLALNGEEAINPANGSECAIISAEHKSLVEDAGLTSWNSAGYFILVVSSKIRQNAAAFVNRGFVNQLLYQLDQYYPDTVSLIKGKFNIDFIVQILRGLIEEQISIRNLAFILDTILRAQSIIDVNFSKYIVFTAIEGMIPSKAKSIDNLEVPDYVELVRIASKRYISHKYTRGNNSLVVYLVDPLIEEELLSKDFGEKEKNDVLNAMRMELGHLPPSSQIPVILTTLEVRKRLWKLIRTEFPHVAVLSYHELSVDLNIQPIARISYPQKPRATQARTI